MYLIAALTALSMAVPALAANCTDFFVPVVAGANNNLVLDPANNLNTVDGVESELGSELGGLTNLIGLVPQNGVYNISARYCAPQPIDPSFAFRSNYVQFLVHGIPYNKDYWNGLNYHSAGNASTASPYSWVDYATSQGYSTVSIDLPGAGNSSHLDPVTQVQQNLETEIVRSFIRMMRSNQAKPAPIPVFIIYVGHSYGSIIGNGIATKYPADLDALILTGYSYTLLTGAVGVLESGLVPASVYSPTKYGSLPPAYVTFGIEANKRSAYYGDDNAFDPALAHYDFSNQDTTTIGSLLTTFIGLQRAVSYTGDVFVITGQEDALFCGDGSRASGVPSCGTGDSSILAHTAAFWPVARYSYYSPNGTGHATTLHYTAQDSFAQAQAFLTNAYLG